MATISPVPTIDPTLTLDDAFPPPLPPDELDDSAAFATEFVVPPFPPDFESVGVVVGSSVLGFESVLPPFPPELPELPPLEPVLPPLELFVLVLPLFVFDPV